MVYQWIIRSSAILLAAISILPRSSGESNTAPITASVFCKSGLDVQYVCTFGSLSAKTWTARASLDSASINTTGWGRLVVETNGEAAKVSN